MRQILFSILFAGAAMVATAQNFSIGVNGGGGYSTAAQSLNKQTEILSNQAAPVLSPFAALKAAITFGNWQCGLSLENKTAKYRSEPLGGDMYFPNGIPAVVPTYVLLSSAGLTPLRAFVNRQVSLNKFSIYGGMAASYIITPHPDGRPWFGYGAGAQCGALYPIRKHISVNMEVTVDKMWFKQRADCLLSMYNSTASLGLTYRLK